MSPGSWADADGTTSTTDAANPSSTPQRRMGNGLAAQLRPQDADEADHLARIATEVVRQREVAVGHGGDLTVGRRLAAQLQPRLEHHPQAGRADGVAEALQPSVGVDRKVAGQVEGARLDLLPRRA